ncbi:MAG: lysophospholipid acyltransferase family protein [Bacteroidales bacterium]
MNKRKFQQYISFPILGFQHLISFLPLLVLYSFSGLLSWLFRNVFYYRLSVVRENLRKSFPDKPKEELIKIEKAFYRNLTDVMVEVIKLKSISSGQLRNRCFYTRESVELLNQYYREGKSILIVMGHMGNWEWAGAAYPLWNSHQIITAYRPLSNKAWNLYMYNMRSRTGNIIVPMKSITRQMLKMRNEVTGTALIADQTPSVSNAYWVKFLNQETPFFKGAEILSKKFDLPVFWGCVKRVQRGYYKIDLQLITDKPQSFEKEGSLTRLHASFLERDIQEQPESWLWSHRRWKHKMPENAVSAAD